MELIVHEVVHSVPSRIGKLNVFVKTYSSHGVTGSKVSQRSMLTYDLDPMIR